MNTPAFSTAPPRIALVGDRSASVQAHAKIPGLVETLSIGRPDPIEVYWIHSTAIESAADVAGFDGVWVIPGSPYANSAGVLAAVEGARTAGIPLLGTCGGFQHLLIEFARNVCGLTSVQNAEEFPEADELIIQPLECSLLGEESSVLVVAGTVAAAAMGQGLATER
jgi:CTP synthase (UTP-ammonia lyase)